MRINPNIANIEIINFFDSLVNVLLDGPYIGLFKVSTADTIYCIDVIFVVHENCTSNPTFWFALNFVDDVIIKIAEPFEYWHWSFEVNPIKLIKNLFLSSNRVVWLGKMSDPNVHGPLLSAGVNDHVVSDVVAFCTDVLK